MLPSQIARTDATRSHMYRRKRRKPWPMIIGTAAILLGAGVVFKWWSGSNRPTPADGATEQSTTQTPEQSQTSESAQTSVARAGSALAEPAPVTPPAAKRSNSMPAEPPRITMGGGSLPAPDASASRTSAGNTQTSAPQLASKPAPTTSPNPAISTPKGPTLVSPPATTPAQLNRPSTGSSSGAAGSGSADQALRALGGLNAQNKPLEARKLLNTALQAPNLSATDAARLREELAKINERLVFGPESVPGDPFATTYQIEPGDSLAKLPRKLGLHVDWRFLQRINRLSSPDRIRSGQRIKIVKGPFHAVIHKSSYRMDLYLGNGKDRTYVRSFPVGLGEYGGTPEGAFVVKTDSKLINPEWVNPRTGQRYAADDPQNPIGEYWIGLIGVSDNVRGLEGYGIHGTIDPDSIGQQRSMGCVRMHADDVALVYELLVENASTIEIHGAEYP